MAWGLSGDELWICFNRDEQRNRPEAEPPVVNREGSNAVAYARDPLGGGTWLAVSEAGFIIALMNQYTDKPGGIFEPTSRGLIVSQLIQAKSPEMAMKGILGMDSLSNFAPFYLFLLTRAWGNHWSWNGNNLDMNVDCPQFWTTSSYKPREVCSWRSREWQKLTGEQEPSHEKAESILKMRSPDPAYGMTMDRDDARTVSQTCILLGKNTMRMQYARRASEELSYEKPILCQW